MLVHGGDFNHGYDALRCRGSITQGAMWPDRVVVSTPLLDDNVGFLQCVEDLANEQFVPEAGIEALAVSVLPRRAWLDVGGLCTDRGYPVPDVPSVRLICVNTAFLISGRLTNERVSAMKGQPMENRRLFYLIYLAMLGFASLAMSTASASAMPANRALSSSTLSNMGLQKLHVLNVRHRGGGGGMYYRGGGGGHRGGYGGGRRSGYHGGYSGGRRSGYHSGYSVRRRSGYHSGYSVGRRSGYVGGYNRAYRGSYRGGYRGARHAARYNRRHHGPRYRHRHGRYHYNYGGYWYAFPWWLGVATYPYYDDYSYAPEGGGYCADIHRACVARWGYGNSNYVGCMRYDNCAPQ